MYSFKLRDVNLKTNTALNTLLIVDGYIIDNHNDFIAFDAKKIKSIEVIREEYYFGAKLFQGIININTFGNLYKPQQSNNKKFTLLKPLEEKIIFHPNYDKNKLQKIPDFRTQLYWNPSIKLNTQKLSFYTSDVAGIYKIEIQGYTKHNKPISKEIFFTVK